MNAANETKFSVRGLVGTVLFHLFLLLMFFFFFLGGNPVPQEELNGIAINFGTVKESAGEAPSSSDAQPEPVENTETVEESAENSTEASAQDANYETEVETAANENPTLNEEKVEKDEPIEETEEEEAESTPPPPQEVVEEKPEIDERGLFGPRKTDDNDSNSEGDSSNPNNNMGASTGTSETVNIYDGMRTSGGGTISGLSGRNLVSLPDINDKSQYEGIIAIKVKVDRSGKVYFAEYSSRGSTSTNSTLKRLALEASKKSKFNAAVNSPEIQIGVMYFTFKVN